LTSWNLEKLFSFELVTKLAAAYELGVSMGQRLGAPD